MVKENEQTINQKIQAAAILRFPIEKEYRKVGGSYLMVLKVKGKEAEFTWEIDKAERLAIWNQQIAILQQQIPLIQEDIDKINAIED